MKLCLYTKVFQNDKNTDWITVLDWATPFEIHTPPVDDFCKLSTKGVTEIFHRGSMDSKWISQLNTDTPT